MEIYQTARSCGRPYNATCGMARETIGNQPCSCRPSPRNQRVSSIPCPSCRMPSASSRDSEMYAHIDEMQIAMAYVPCQKFSTTYDLNYALNAGTVFPDLCKPFCGKRGGRR